MQDRLNFKELVKKSRSYRRFKGNYKVSKGALIDLIELARLAPCTRNQQALKFILSFDFKKNDLIFPALSWAGALKDWKGPASGEKPSCYIIILGDKEISSDFAPDYGIAAQNILLGATEMGLGGAMLGSIDRKKLRGNLKIDNRYEILLVVAIGKPNEKIIVEDAQGDNVNYYRDKNDAHHVPKRKIEDIILE